MEGNIYCLRSAELFYVGSTKRSLEKRLIEHKADVNNKYVASSQIIQQGDYEIHLIEKCPLNNIRKREGEIIKHFKEMYGSMCVNELIAGREWKERRADKPKIIKERSCQTKEEIEAKRSVHIECQCGVMYQLKHKSRHQKSKYHLDNLN
jgi:hypothetical protein